MTLVPRRFAAVAAVFFWVQGASFAVEPASLAAPSSEVAAGDGETALALAVGDSGRDAILFRNEDGSGFSIFAPLATGGFELRIYSGDGPNVEQIVAADVDGDSATDLISVRRDATQSKWLANDAGAWSPEEAIGTMTHDEHAAHRAHPQPVDPAHAAHLAAAAQAARSVLLRSGLSTLGADGRLDAVRGEGGGRLGGAALATVRELGLATIEADGRSLRLRDASGASITIPGSVLPEAFRPRMAALGRFGDGGEAAVAAIGFGERPRLFLVDLPSGARKLTRDSLEVREASPAFATFVVNVGMGGLVFAPTTANINPGDTVQWNWAGIGHTVTSGSGCTADNQFCSPTNTNCATAPTSNTGAVYSRVFPSSGSFPYFCRPHCIGGMTGTVIVGAAAAPGTVPDGSSVPGVPLTIGKGAGGSIDINWSASCSPGANNYALYHGALPITGTYTHVLLDCGMGNISTINFVPSAADKYYLVVPMTASTEGSYGSDFIGGVEHAIPAAATPCKPQSLSACP